MEVRSAYTADLPAVVACVDAAYSKWIPVIGMKPRPMLADYTQLINQEKVFVLEQIGEVIAVIVMWQKDDALYIDNIAVAPGHQRSGIGKQLLDYAEASARAIGVRRLTLCTNQKMVYNQQYYLKSGYRITHTEISGDDRHVVWMDKLLP